MVKLRVKTKTSKAKTKQRNPYYSNQEGIRNNGIKLKLTQWQKDEIEKCRDDMLYFIRNYCYIYDLDEGLILFEPRPYQLELLNAIIDNRMCIANYPRRAGKTSIVVAYCIHQMIFNEFFVARAYADGDENATTFTDMAQTMYAELPYWFQIGVTAWNNHGFSIENGSSLYAKCTTARSGRSKAITFLYIDEGAHIEHKIWKMFWMGVEPTTSSGSSSKIKIVITSTPKGYNHFFEIHRGGELGTNQFFPLSIDWQMVPDKTTKSGFRDKEFRDKKLASGYTEREFAQEYEASFVGSGHNLLESGFISTWAKFWEKPIDPKRKLKLKKKGKTYEYAVYEEPKPNHKYIMTVDASEGLGKDNTSINIIDITEVVRFKQVAVLRDNKMHPRTDLPYVMAELGWTYNNAMIIFERNYALEACYICRSEVGYDNFFVNMEDKEYGFKIGNNKNIGLSTLKDLIEKNKFLISDGVTKHEFLTFVEKGSSYEAEDGYKDDDVMSLNQFGYFMSKKSRFERYINDLGLAVYQRDILDYENQIMEGGVVALFERGGEMINLNNNAQVENKIPRRVNSDDGDDGENGGWNAI